MFLRDFLRRDNNENHKNAKTYELSFQALSFCLLSGSCCSFWFPYHAHLPLREIKAVRNPVTVSEKKLFCRYVLFTKYIA